MVTYGKAECARCYVRLPKPELYKASVMRLTVRSPSRRTYYNRFGHRTGSSARDDTVGFRRRKIWLCPSCYRRRVRQHLIALGLAAVLVLIFAALSNDTRSPIGRPSQVRIAVPSPD